MPLPELRRQKFLTPSASETFSPGSMPSRYSIIRHRLARPRSVGPGLRLLVPSDSIFTRSARHRPMKPSDAASCLAYCSFVGSPKSMLVLASIRA